jgi:hypothetical protein
MSGFLLVRLYEGLDKKTPGRFGTLYTGDGEVSCVPRRIGPVKDRRHSTCQEGDVQAVFIGSDINFHLHADASR